MRTVAQSEKRESGLGRVALLSHWLANLQLSRSVMIPPAHGHSLRRRLPFSAS